MAELISLQFFDILKQFWEKRNIFVKQYTSDWKVLFQVFLGHCKSYKKYSALFSSHFYTSWIFWKNSYCWFEVISNMTTLKIFNFRNKQFFSLSWIQEFSLVARYWIHSVSHVKTKPGAETIHTEDKLQYCMCWSKTRQQNWLQL